MLKNLYFLIIIILPLVQITMCTNIIPDALIAKHSTLGKLKTIEDSRDARGFGSVLEHHTRKTPLKKYSVVTLPQWTTTESKTAEEKPYDEIKTLLMKVLEQIEDIEKKSDKEVVNIKENNEKTQESGQLLLSSSKDEKKKRKDCRDTKIKWGHWTDWSSCSVSCGKGRQIRWRHCIENCSEAETEMEEKVCQLPACGPGKLFGVIKI